MWLLAVMKSSTPRDSLQAQATSLTCSLAISTRYLYVQIYVQLAEKKTIMRTIASRRCLLHYVTFASQSFTPWLLLRGGLYEETSRGRLSIEISSARPLLVALLCRWLTVCIQEDVNILMGK